MAERHGRPDTQAPINLIQEIRFMEKNKLEGQTWKQRNKSEISTPIQIRKKIVAMGYFLAVERNKGLDHATVR